MLTGLIISNRDKNVDAWNGSYFNFVIALSFIWRTLSFLNGSQYPPNSMDDPPDQNNTLHLFCLSLVWRLLFPFALIRSEQVFIGFCIRFPQISAFLHQIVRSILTWRKPTHSGVTSSIPISNRLQFFRVGSRSNSCQLLVCFAVRLVGLLIYWRTNTACSANDCKNAWRIHHTA